jgi:poly(3-hydroxybutyrate) depolymerase
MIYQMYQAQSDFLDPMRMVARNISPLVKLVTPQKPFGRALRQLTASLDLVGHSGTTHTRPPYGIESVAVGNELVEVIEEVAYDTAFGALLHFRKDTVRPQPKLLLVAPLSGHFATLLRNTVEVLLQDHDVYVTDWHNARDIPLAAGPFGFDEYVAHVMDFLEILGPRSHVVAVCQPAVAVLAAVALMAENNHIATPRSMTLMAGPIDTRQNPTKVNQLAKTKDIDWFEKNLIGVVPWRYKGAGRRVYPGFVQLASFMSMNLDKHMSAHRKQFANLMSEDIEASLAHRKFYDEYLAVMDLPAEFYLETVERIFQTHELPLGQLTWRGRKIKPEAIKRTFLFTVEGERDDICALGQTMAALDLCSNLRPVLKRHHLQNGVGHYGVFSGKRWANEIYPLIREVIHFSR